MMVRFFSAMMAMFCLVCTAKADDITKMRLLPPVKVRCAVQTDSVNTKGAKADKRAILMKSETPLTDDREGAVLLEADSAGCFTLSKEDGNTIYVFTTKVRADRFAKPVFKFTSPSSFEVYVDGKMMRDKKQVTDSVKNAGSCEVEVRMEPHALHTLAVKMLVGAEDACAPSLSASWGIKGDSVTVVSVCPDLKERYLLPNTIYGKRVQNVSISPCGKYLLTTYLDYYNATQHNTYTQLSEVKSGKIIATFPSGYKALSWTPRSSQLYYKVLSDVGEKIILVNPATLEEKLFADHVPGGSFRWAPDEKSLYFSIVEQVEGDKGPVHRLHNRGDRLPNSRGRAFIWRYDVATGVRERLTWGLLSTSLCDVSNDGRYILYSTSQPTDNKWPFSKSSLYCMNVETLQVDTLFTDDYFFGGVARFSPDASQVLLTGGPEAFNGIGKNCGNHPIANNYDSQAFVLTRSSGEIDPITKDFDPTVSFLQWNNNDGCIYFSTEDADQKPIARYNPAKKRMEKVALNGDCVRSFSIAKNGNVAAYTSVTASSGQAAYLYDVRKGKSTLLADPYAEDLKNIELGTIHDWEFTAADGTVVDGFYCLPPSFDATKKYPLIVYYYGGTTPTSRAMDNPYAPQLFSSRGYVTLVLNPSGCTGYGQEFSARHVNAWGERTADEIIEGTKTFCKEHEYVDAEHIGCLGASYGGFMTQYLQTKTDIFAAAASHAGISNIASYWGEGYWGVGYNATAAAQSYPWNNPDLFTKQGSLFNADKINTPLLLLHGTADTNVPIGESIQLYNALRILGKTVEFVRVDGEDHFISDVPKRILWHNSIMAWFERWLKNDASWWNDIYPERLIK